MGNQISCITSCDCVRSLNFLKPPSSQVIEINLRNSRSSIETKMKFNTNVK